jgi:hypothetical protein
MSATISRQSTEKLTSSSTRVPRSNDFETRRTSMTASFGTPSSCFVGLFRQFGPISRM